jgi:hypothetical protein
MPVSKADLDALLGQNISQICGNGYDAPNDNHCAHFVSHAASYAFGTTCRSMKAGTQPGATIRVQELFARCPVVGRWDDRPASLLTCLVFVTAAGNVRIKQHQMDNVPRKHVGIFISGTIWHYSNSQHKVVTQTPEQFIHHYPGSDIALFYGSLPA